MLPSSAQPRLPIAAVLAVGIGAAGAAALAVSNPSLQDYKSEAGDRLVTLAVRELCEEQALPMILRVWIRNCPELVASQRNTLAELAGRFTTRWNFGVASLFTTRIGGQELLPGMRLPAAEVLTLGIAGRFVVLRTETTGLGSE